MTIIILTGAPGVGKTRVGTDVAQKLKERGMRVGGAISREPIMQEQGLIYK